MNIHTYRTHVGLPQFSPDKKEPQSLVVTYQEPALHIQAMGSIPKEVAEPRESVEYSQGVTTPGDGELDTQLIRYGQPIVGSDGQVKMEQVSEVFSYDPKAGLKQRRIAGSALGAAIGGIVGGALALATGNDVVSGAGLGLAVGGGAGLASRWNSSAPVPKLEWQNTSIEKATRLSGYEPSWDVEGKQHINVPNFETKTVGHYFRPFLVT